jgi:hypothetical protein
VVMQPGKSGTYAAQFFAACSKMTAYRTLNAFSPVPPPIPDLHRPLYRPVSRQRDLLCQSFRRWERARSLAPGSPPLSGRSARGMILV